VARIHPLSRDEAAEEIRHFFDKEIEQYGEPLNSSGVYAYRPTILQANKMLGEQIRLSGLVSTRMKSLLCVYIARKIGCPY
jgi:hypothetical protein